jgi:predicted nucleic acid-binding protein
VSLLDSGRIDESRVHGASQLTDLYLLALAVSRGGRLVTFDQRITSTAVLGARPEHLVVI